ncbi:hypothetical protein QBC40DRAFT_294019 [Triangularia verruculosa]|uniref:Uncharacterized protein n=1 Tax=Triangularia verruculosa TaxID=2587418 RepID=A0AAN6XML4_9PEZI|nr:hypothetical protein QBC40DRAFT_294019 [Triangularia verruculosa]
MHASTLLLTTLLAVTINAQSHPMITPAPAALALRQVNDEDDNPDCVRSLGSYVSCIGKAVSTDLCINTANLDVNLECGCSQASSLYACYTSYCIRGTAYTEFASGVDEACGRAGGPAPTGTPNADSDDGDTSGDEDEPTKTGDSAAAGATKPSSAGSLRAGAWGLMAVGAVHDILNGLNYVQSGGAFALVVCLDKDVDPKLKSTELGLRINRQYGSIGHGELDHGEVRHLLTKIKTEHTVRAEISCLVIQDEGPGRDPHSVFTQLPGSCGTLVVQLDSSCEGGEIVLKHGTQEITYDHQSLTPKAMSVAAWYGDVRYTVCPVMSLSRVMLVYSLFIGRTSTPAAPPGLPGPGTHEISGMDTRHLRIAINNWLETQGTNGGPMNCVYHVLEHAYNNDSIKMLIQSIISALHTLHGSVLMEGVSTLSEQDMKCFLQPDPFDDKNVRKEEKDYGKFKGTWGPLATHHYTAQALVLVPRASLSQFLHQRRPLPPTKHKADRLHMFSHLPYAVPDTGVQFAWLADSIGVDGLDWPPFQNSLIEICESLLKPGASDKLVMREFRSASDTLQHCLMATIRLGRFDLFRQVAACNAGNMRVLIAEFSTWVRDYILSSPDGASHRFAAIREGLDILLNSYVNNLTYRIQALKFLAPRANPTPGLPEFDRWVYSTIQKCLEDLTQCGEKLGEHESLTLLELAYYLPSSEVVKFFSETVLTILPPSKFPPAIFISLLGSLSTDVQTMSQGLHEKNLRFDSLAVADELYHAVARPLLQCIDLTRLMPHDWDEEERDTMDSYGKRAKKGVSTINGKDLEK